MSIRSKEELREGGVSLLGNKNNVYPTTYTPEVLETFDNKHPDNDYVVTFDAYEFTSLCVAGDTLIEVIRNNNVETIRIEDLVGTSGYAFGVNPKTLEIVCREYKDVRKTQENVPVIRIRFKKIDSSIESVTVTPNHLVLVRHSAENIEWIEAKDLKPGMILVDYYAAVTNFDSDNISKMRCEVIGIEDCGNQDVYNMEVDEVENFFGNGIILHNCPITSQPDFAKVVISYIPNTKMVESKSLKLYLFSFRGNGDFHEDCCNIIMKDLIKLMDPKYIEVRCIFSPRGGISIFPMANWANPNFNYANFAKQRQLDVLRDAANRTVRYDI